MNGSLPLVVFREPRMWWLAALVAGAVAIIWWRYGRQSGTWAVPVLRLAAVLLFGAALAQPLVARPSSERGTILLVDASRSMGGARGAALERQVRESARAATVKNPLALVAFAERPALVHTFGLTPVTIDTALGALTTADVGSRGETDIEAALRFAETVAMSRAGARIVLATDGEETRGRALAWASEAAGRGIAVIVVPLTMSAWQADVALASLDAPASSWQGSVVDITVAVTSPTPVTASVLLSVDGQPATPRSLSAGAGLSSVRFALGPLSPGYHALTAEVQAPGDPVAENNLLGGTIVVRERPRALVVVGAPGTNGALIQGLNRASWNVTVLAATALPPQVANLAGYDTIILVDVPAADLSYDWQVALRDFVGKLGRGLVVSGAASSYGRGGYEGTVLESVLPVEVKPRPQGQRQPVALLLVLDRSYSMTVPTPGPSRIDMAKSAAAGAVRALAPGDQIAVLTFSDTFKWVTRLRTLQSQADIDSVVADIAQVTADGETQMYPALVAALDELSRSQLDTRHIVLLSDGQPSQAFSAADFTRRVRDAGLTMSTIAIGESADVPLMQDLARGGNGRYSFARKPEEIPRLTLAEATELGGKVVATGAFLPAPGSTSAILRGLDTGALPRLLGYDVTRVKPAAQAVLVAGQGEPVLAQWQYGLGRVVAWTSDTGDLYAPAWRQGGLLDRLFNQAARWTLSTPQTRYGRFGSTPVGGDLVVTVDAADALAADGSGSAVADVVSPGGGTARVALPQVGPGRYEVRLANAAPGPYQFTVTLTTPGGVVRDVAGAAMPYPQEYRADTGDSGLLAELARVSGGSIVPGVSGLLASAPAGVRSRLVAIWQWPLTVGLLCFVLDIALRLGHGLPRPGRRRLTPTPGAGGSNGERRAA